jgi:hypothetical protein
MPCCRHEQIVHRLVQLWDSATSNIDTRRVGRYSGMSILSRTVEYGWEAVTQTVIERMHPFNPASQEATEALCDCTLKGWFNNLRMLLKRGVDASARSQVGEPALLTACKTSQPMCVRALVDAGSRFLESAVLVCIWTGCEESFRIVWLKLMQLYANRNKHRPKSPSSRSCSESSASLCDKVEKDARAKVSAVIHESTQSPDGARADDDGQGVSGHESCSGKVPPPCDRRESNGSNSGRLDGQSRGREALKQEPQDVDTGETSLEDLIRTCACVASLRNRFDMLKVIMTSAQKAGDSHGPIHKNVHTYGVKIREIMQAWPGFPSLHMIAPNLLRNLHTIGA